ncbi:MAG: hypothetical protein OXC56_05020 [Chloroflexi bacterium]|nr:hypothetical protein [Chloroflexota bacterium]
MSEVPLLLAVFWAATNPPASLASLPEPFEGVERSRRAALVLAGWVVAAALLVLAALLHGPFLDLLDVSASSFDIAAGIVMLAGAWRPLLRGRAIEEATASLLDASPRAALAPLAVPLLASPAALAAAIAYGDRAGEAPAIAVAAVVSGVAALAMLVGPSLRWRHRHALDAALARLTGALLVAVAVGLIVDGVLNV